LKTVAFLSSCHRKCPQHHLLNGLLPGWKKASNPANMGCCLIYNNELLTLVWGADIHGFSRWMKHY